MAEIRPFRAYRYDTNRVALKDVLTQPYDKITPEMQERYYAASPYNLIAIEKGQAGGGRYAREQCLYAGGGEGGGMDCRENSGAGWGAGDLRLRAGLSGAGDADAANANRVHCAGARGRLQRGGGVPARADAFGAEG